MEYIYSIIREQLKESIKIENDDKNYTIYVWVRSKRDSDDPLGSPEEIEEMLRIFGGLTKSIAMKIEINNNSKIFKIIMDNPEDYQEIKGIMENIWDKTADLIVQVNSGNLTEFRKIQYED